MSSITLGRLRRPFRAAVQGWSSALSDSQRSSAGCSMGREACEGRFDHSYSRSESGAKLDGGWRSLSWPVPVPISNDPAYSSRPSTPIAWAGPCTFLACSRWACPSTRRSSTLLLFLSLQLVLWVTAAPPSFKPIVLSLPPTPLHKPSRQGRRAQASSIVGIISALLPILPHPVDLEFLDGEQDQAMRGHASLPVLPCRVASVRPPCVAHFNPF